MKTCRLLIIGLFIVICTFFWTCDKVKNPFGLSGFGLDLITELQTTLEDAIHEFRAAGTIAIIRRPDGVTWTGTAGVSPSAPPEWSADGDSLIYQGTPLTTNTRFRAGSVTKTFTAVLICVLASDGLISLDDTIEHWLPGIVANSDIITIRQLLDMTSGLQDYEPVVTDLAPDDPDRHWTPQEIIDLFKDWPPVFDPGTDWLYTNSGYVLLARIAELASGGTSYHDLVRTRIIEPLGLTGTFMPESGTMPEPYARAWQFFLEADPQWVEVTDWDPSYAWSAGHIVSTPEDLLVFLRSIFQGTLMGSEYRDAMLDTKPTGKGNYSYGYAIAEAVGMVGHAGYIFGYSTAMFRYKDYYDIVIMTTCLVPQISDLIYLKLAELLPEVG